MKKFLLVVLAMVMLGSVQAQTSFKNKVEGLTGTEFYFGPKFGFNVASISDGLNKSKFSFHLGAFAEFKFNDLFGLQTELIYSRQGDKGKSDCIKRRCLGNSEGKLSGAFSLSKRYGAVCL